VLQVAEDDLTPEELGTASEPETESGAPALPAAEVAPAEEPATKAAPAKDEDDDAEEDTP
jgi:hypothetical protein